MNKNIVREWHFPIVDGRVDATKPKVPLYCTKSTDDLQMPSLGFDREEDAELAVAIAKSLKARNSYYYQQHLHDDIKYVFRALGLIDTGWTDTNWIK